VRISEKVNPANFIDLALVENNSMLNFEMGGNLIIHEISSELMRCDGFIADRDTFDIGNTECSISWKEI
jgi:hypothetical protein